jgi:hypothetical protein
MPVGKNQQQTFFSTGGAILCRSHIIQVGDLQDAAPPAIGRFRNWAGRCDSKTSSPIREPLAIQSTGFGVASNGRLRSLKTLSDCEMANTTSPEPEGSKAGKPVLDWLLDSDPSIRWQVMRDLAHAPAEEIAAERVRVATEGAGGRLLSQQGAEGSWAGAAWNQGCDSTMHVLSLLRELGIDPASDEARRAVGLVSDHVTWQGCGPQECDANPFFAGEVEPCINGQVAACGAYFGQDVERIVNSLLREQLADGGWNCEAADGSIRSSFNTTICVLEALLEYELAGGSSAEVTDARLRGQEYLLDRRLFRRRSTGEVIEQDRKGGTVWTRFSFPTWWHYDVLRGLEYLRRAGASPDERVAEAIKLVESKRDGDGRWPLENRHTGTMPVEMDDSVGRPSRWNTLRALRVLEWYSARN